MDSKKTERANLDKQRGIFGNFFLIGLLISIGLVVIAFQWKGYEKTEKPDKTGIKVPDDSEMTEVTQQKKQPPKPEVPTEVDIISDDKRLDDTRKEMPKAEAKEVGKINLPNKFKEEEKEEDPVFRSVQEKPSFPGGKEARIHFIKNHLNYPRQAKEAGIQGIVLVHFVVNKDGSISRVKVQKGVSKSLNEEAKRVVKAMPNWEPGKQRGQKVRATFSVPIQFKIGH